MNRNRIRQIILLGAGTLASGLPFAGCYPLIPALFTALYLAGIRRFVTAAFLYGGMFFFLPLPQIAKYGMALLVILIVIRLVEWNEKGCPGWLAAAVSGGVTTALAVSGTFLGLKEHTSYLMGVLEGILVFGLSVIFQRAVHTFLEYPFEFGKEQVPATIKEPDDRLLKYADSFQGLSRLFSGMEERKYMTLEEMNRLTGEVTEKYCADCSGCAICWQEEGLMQQKFKNFLVQIFNMGSLDQQMQSELERNCPYSKEVVQEIIAVFEKIRLNRAWYNRMVENRVVIAEQLDAMAYIMEDIAEGREEITRRRKKYVSDLKFRAKEYGITVTDIRIYAGKEGREEVCMEVCRKKEGCVPIKDLTAAVNKASPVIMTPRKDSRNIIGKEPAEIVFEEETFYHTVFGIAKQVKEKNSVSGDNFSVIEKAGGEVVYSLSDGMGFGSRACKESELVLELIEKFLEAGFDEKTAIRMMNSAMVIHGEDRSYSTIDIASLDLYTGKCRFYKIGAAATFIKRKQAVEALESSSLPVGSYYGLEIETKERELENGDFLIMVTDGVLEDLHVPDPLATMQEIIETTETNHPGKMADRILERVMLFTGGHVRDDMTILVAALWEN